MDYNLIYMQEIFAGILGIVMGVLGLVFKEQLARRVVEFNNKTMPFKYGEREVIKFTRGNRFIAIALIAMGILGLASGFGWIHLLNEQFS